MRSFRINIVLTENPYKAKVSVAEEAVLATLPETTDATYGDLIYFSDFDENTNWVNTAVVGENATASFQLAYVQKGNWGSNKVADPNGENGNVQEIIVADHKYNWASGINVAVNNATLEDAVITMVYDVYFPNPVEECFKAQLSSGWEIVSSADYDAEKGGWQTIVMNIIAGANVSNGQYGFNFICNDTDKTSGSSGGATAGLTYYIDNVKVYAKDLTYAEKPAQYDASKGILVYFDNGNADDFYSDFNASLIGHTEGKVYAADGYASRDFYNNTAAGISGTVGFGVTTGDSATKFAYADGTDMNGILYIAADMYNTTSADNSFYYYVRDWAWDGWCGGYTNWQSVKALAGQWSVISKSYNTEMYFIGFADTNNGGYKGIYFKDVYVYYLPEANVTVDGKMYDLNGKTEFVLPAFETAEYNSYKDADGKVYNPGTYAAADVNKKVFTPHFEPYYAEKPAETTENGELVFFYNGNAADTVNTLGADIIGEGSMGVYDGYHVTYTTDCIALIGSCSSHGMAIAPANGSYAKNGRITLVVEQYNNMTNKANVEYTALSDTKLGAYTSAWSNKFADYGTTYNTYPGNWYTLKANAVTENNLVGFFERTWVNHANLTRGFKSIYVYLDSYKVTIGDTVVDLADYKEYTMPSLDGTEYTVYKDADGNYYFPGKAYASTVLDGKTLTAVKVDYATKPADFSHGRGILVYFDNGNEADFYSNMNATLVGYKNTTDADGYFTRDLGNPAAAGISSTVGIGLDTGDTDVKLAYADGTDMKGAIYLVVDMYNNTDSNNSFYRGVRTNGWDGWCGVYTDWKGYNAAARTWSNLAEAFDTELSFIGFADTDNGNWQGSTFRSVYAYYMPNTRVALDVSGTPEIIDLTGKTEYTFPEITDGVNNVWRDSKGVYYFPGDVAAVEDINTNTYFAANFNAYAPETESDVEMRVTSNTANNGIRFKASIAPSKKAEADEIGFIVARGDVLENLDAELTFDLTAEGVDNAEGKLFVKGVAYDKASDKDVVYDTNEDGTEVFTGVCVGIDVTNKAQVNTVLVARPYLKMTVGEKQIAVYGAANSASLASVANDIKTAAEAGDEAALEAYNGAKEYIDGVISVGAGK